MPTTPERTEAASTTTPAVPFRDALRDAAAIAALSPSSHNCQPWALAHLASAAACASTVGNLTDISRDDEHLALGLDRDRQLHALPAHTLEMLLSCGIYAQVLLRGLAAHGWRTDRADLAITRPPVETWPANWRPLALFRLRPGRPSSERIGDLLRLAHARRTNRGPHRPGAVDGSVLERLAEPGAALAAGARVVIRHLDGADDRERFAGLVARRGGRDFSDLRVWRETHSYMRSSDTRAARAGDGFSLTQLFGPLSPPRRYFLRTALAPSTMRMLRHAGYHRLLARELAAVVRTSPVIVAMSLPSRSPADADVLRAGARLADYWLAATAAGLVLHPVSVLIQHDDIRDELQHEFGLQGRVFFLARLGHPSMRFERSPRRPGSAGWRTL